ncbi:ubiquinol-cytochrome c reductase core subunit 1 [Friedmanniomyces endolithicus]|nr:ubiquinol-cytochrome c reductase core subunit 1 [Friedmanniomyces endolithicus]
MLSRSAFRQATRQSWLQQRRGMAAPASGSFQYQVGEAAGIKIASRDTSGPIGTIALVAQAGTRYETMPGLAEGLNKYAFKNTDRRTSLRIQRESELLGGSLISTHTRENLVTGAKFFRDDLPYFVELLAEVASQTSYRSHVMQEEVIPLVMMDHKKFLANTLEMALSSVHSLAFHRGLGNTIKPASSTPYTKYLTAESLEDKWTNEFFGDARKSPLQQLTSPQSKYYGGEERISHGSGNSMVIAFSGSSSPTGASYKPEAAVLAALLGGQSAIKWSPGFSLLSKATQEAPNMHVATKSNIYTDAGLVTIAMDGSATDIRSTAGKVVEALKSVAQNISKEDFQKAKALAKFKELEYGQEPRAALELTGAGLVRDNKPYQIDDVAKSIDGVTEDKVKKLVKEALENKASVSAVGDLYLLPFAEELGLKV